MHNKLYEYTTCTLQQQPSSRGMYIVDAATLPPRSRVGGIQVMAELRPFRLAAQCKPGLWCEVDAWRYTTGQGVGKESWFCGKLAVGIVYRKARLEIRGRRSFT